MISQGLGFHLRWKKKKVEAEEGRLEELLLLRTFTVNISLLHG